MFLVPVEDQGSARVTCPLAVSYGGTLEGNCPLVPLHQRVQLVPHQEAASIVFAGNNKNISFVSDGLLSSERRDKLACQSLCLRPIQRWVD